MSKPRKSKAAPPTPAGRPASELILYQTKDKQTRIEVRLENKTVWLTQAQLTDLFQRKRSVITKHIRNIFEEGELVEHAVYATYAQTAADGKAEYEKFRVLEAAKPSPVEKDFDAAVKNLKKLPVPGRKKKKS